jgi:hypothetical protein
MSQTAFDARLRLAAAAHFRRISAGGVLTSDDLRAGFTFEGARVPLINPQRGIFKPTALRYLLSVRTVYPSTGRKVWYDDQRQVHAQILRGDEVVDYAFMGRDPGAADNRWLREAARIGASNGSACTTGMPELSHVLKAIGLSGEEAAASIRFSIGRGTTYEDLEEAVQLINQSLLRLFDVGLS